MLYSAQYYYSTIIIIITITVLERRIVESMINKKSVGNKKFQVEKEFLSFFFFQARVEVDARKLTPLLNHARKDFPVGGLRIVTGLLMVSSFENNLAELSRVTR